MFHFRDIYANDVYSWLNEKCNLLVLKGLEKKYNGKIYFIMNWIYVYKLDHRLRHIS